MQQTTVLLSIQKLTCTSSYRKRSVSWIIFAPILLSLFVAFATLRPSRCDAQFDSAFQLNPPATQPTIAPATQTPSEIATPALDQLLGNAPAPVVQPNQPQPTQQPQQIPPQQPYVQTTPYIAAPAPPAPPAPVTAQPAPAPSAPQTFPPAAVPNGNSQRLVSLTAVNTQAISTKLKNLFDDRFRVTFANEQMTATLVDRRFRPIAALSSSSVAQGIVVSGEPRVVTQLAALIGAFDQNEFSVTKTIVVQRATYDRADRPSTRDSSQYFLPKPRQRTIAQVQYVEQVQATLPVPDGQQMDPALRKRLRDLGDDVQVEVLPDLDVVVLRGRDQDIDELARIIQRLEEMAAGAQPTIEVYQLQHVPGESLAEIIEDISDNYTGPRQGRVTVTPLGKPNALLVVGWGTAMKATLDLIAKLDKPVKAETQLKVIPLTNAPAGKSAETIQDFFDDREGLGPQVNVAADPRTNSLIVNAAPRDIEEVMKMVEQLDNDRTKSVDQANVIQLLNSRAQDVANVLEEALNNTQSNNTDTRSAALEFLAGEAGAQQLLRSGDLTSVKITPSPRNNAIIVTGPPDSVKLIRALIQRLDKARDAAQLKVFRIVNGDAGSLVQVLRSLLVSSGGGGGGNAAAGGTLGLANAAGESSLTPLRFSIEERNNEIIAVGPKGDLEIVEALLARLDAEGSNERMNAVYHLKNAPATDVARTINEFLRSERLLDQAGQAAASTSRLVAREVIVVPETVSNKLVLSATPQYFRQLNELIQRLDEAPPQVMIQVLIGEVQLSNVEEFGVEVGLQSSVLFDRSLLEDLNLLTNTTQTQNANGVVSVTEQIIAAANNTPGFNFNNSPLGNSGSTQALNSRGNIGTQALGNFALGRSNSELGFGGLVLSASSDSVSVLIRALEESRRLEVLSRPQIRTLDNQPAFIQVGQVVPFITNSSITQFGQTNSIDFRDVGLILGVTPRISPDGTVVMEIDAEKSSVGPEEQGIPISATLDGTVIRAPSIETTRAQTTVSAASGETIVLGGLITKTNASTERGVPYLSDVPFLGDLFTYENNETQRSELLIILTPHVIRNSADNERIKQTEMARMSWCAADVYDMHGDVNFQFAEDSMNFNAACETIYPGGNPMTNGPSYQGSNQGPGSGPNVRIINGNNGMPGGYNGSGGPGGMNTIPGTNGYTPINTGGFPGGMNGAGGINGGGPNLGPQFIQGAAVRPPAPGPNALGNR